MSFRPGLREDVPDHQRQSRGSPWLAGGWFRFVGRFCLGVAVNKTRLGSLPRDIYPIVGCGICSKGFDLGVTFAVVVVSFTQDGSQIARTWWLLDLNTCFKLCSPGKQVQKFAGRVPTRVIPMVCLESSRTNPRGQAVHDARGNKSLMASFCQTQRPWRIDSWRVLIWHICDSDHF